MSVSALSVATLGLAGTVTPAQVALLGLVALDAVVPEAPFPFQPQLGGGLRGHAPVLVPIVEVEVVSTLEPRPSVVTAAPSLHERLDAQPPEPDWHTGPAELEAPAVERHWPVVARTEVVAELLPLEVAVGAAPVELGLSVVVCRPALQLRLPTLTLSVLEPQRLRLRL